MDNGEEFFSFLIKVNLFFNFSEEIPYKFPHFTKEMWTLSADPVWVGKRKGRLRLEKRWDQIPAVDLN